MIDGDTLRLVNALLGIAAAGLLCFRLVNDWRVLAPIIRARVAAQVLLYGTTAYASWTLHRIIGAPTPDYLPVVTVALVGVVTTLAWPGRRVASH